MKPNERDIEKARAIVAKFIRPFGDGLTDGIAEALAAERASLPESVGKLIGLARAFEDDGSYFGSLVRGAYNDLRAWQAGETEPTQQEYIQMQKRRHLKL